jgi:hypothetical protein
VHFESKASTQEAVRVNPAYLLVPRTSVLITIFGTLSARFAGDPQRFLFASVTNPDLENVFYSFPEPITLDLAGTAAIGEVTVDPTISHMMRSRKVRVNRGAEITDPLDSHRDLLTLKMAALLSILEGHDDLAVTIDP